MVMTLLRLNYLVYDFGNCVDNTTIEIGTSSWWHDYPPGPTLAPAHGCCALVEPSAHARDESFRKCLAPIGRLCFVSCCSHD